MELSREGVSWGTIFLLIAAAILIVARFTTYIEVATDANLDVVDTLTWWATFLIGIILVGAGALDEFSGSEGAEDRAWMGLLFGLLILVVMPASPLPGDAFAQMFGNMFGA